MTNELSTYELQLIEQKKTAETTARTLRAYARDIAIALADGWTVKPIDPAFEFTQSHPHLVHAATGAEFWIGTDWRDKNKLNVNCNWPKDAQGKEHRPYFSQHSDNGAAAPSIGFSRSKSAAVAAKDIARRFLPAFLPLWAKQAATVASWDDARAKRTRLAGQIAALLGGTVSTPQYQSDRQADVYLGYRPHGISEVKFGSDPDELTVKVRCTFEELKTLAQLFPWQAEYDQQTD